MSQSHSIQQRREKALGEPRRKRPRHRRLVVAPELLADIPRSLWAATARLDAELRCKRRDPQTFVGLSFFGVTCSTCHDTRRFLENGRHNWMMCPTCGTPLSQSEVAAVWEDYRARAEEQAKADAANWAFAQGDGPAEKGTAA